ncbi:MAG: hypothetical protein NTX91_03975 [candidate division SR1 bacterium]|nr:hypothetical protein [candidate division SR1 bacterium]
MFKDILQNSIKAMSNDNKIIRLTWVTSFFHSMIAVLLIIININSLIVKNYSNGLYVGRITEYFTQQINQNHVISIIIWITVGLFLAYSIIYPIGQGAIIHYLNNRKQTVKEALRAGRKDFFAMFETSFISVVTHPVILILAAFKILIIEGHITIINIVLLGIWLTVLNIINTLKAYTRYIVVIEQLPLYEALKKSAKMCRQNMNNNYRYMRVQTMLLINFSVNLIIIIGVPALLIYGAISLNIIQYLVVKILVYVLFVSMVLLGSYISAIIRAFFAYYRYEIYKIAKKQTT